MPVLRDARVGGRGAQAGAAGGGASLSPGAEPHAALSTFNAPVNGANSEKMRPNAIKQSTRGSERGASPSGLPAAPGDRLKRVVGGWSAGRRPPRPAAGRAPPPRAATREGVPEPPGAAGYCSCQGCGRRPFKK